MHADAYVAPTAVVFGAVRIDAGARVLFGAVVTAEDGRVEVGPNSVVMENALVRGRSGHDTTIGRDVLVGPHAHVNGALVEDGVFLATGVAVFPGPPRRSRRNGTTRSGHVKSRWTFPEPCTAYREEHHPKN